MVIEMIYCKICSKMFDSKEIVNHECEFGCECSDKDRKLCSGSIKPDECKYISGCKIYPKIYGLPRLKHLR